MRKTERWIAVGIAMFLAFYMTLKYQYYAALYFYSIYVLVSIFASLAPAGTTDALGFSGNFFL